MARFKITFSDKRIKSEIVSAKTKGEAINKSKDVPSAFFKVKKLSGKRRK